MEVVKAGTSSARSQASDESEESNNDGGASDGQSLGGYELEAAAAMAVPGDVTIRISVASCQGITVDKISSQVWRDAKLQIRRLLDQSLAPAERQQIAASLTDMCDRMETKNILETNIPRNVRLAVQLGPAPLAAIASDQASGSDGFNDRLRERIAEFNHGLVSLADGISRLKNKLLTLECCAPSSAARLAADSAIDAHVCRSIHKNFRRILQKESRFLRDELFAAKETIYRLERRAGPRPDDQPAGGQLVPYHEYPAAAFHPAAYFNVEHAPPPLWPHCAASAPGCVAYPAAAAAMWERVYAHPELSRQLQCYSVCDPGLQCLPAQQQPVCGSSGALCVPQQSPEWTPIERSLTDDSRRPRDECPEEANK